MKITDFTAKCTCVQKNTTKHNSMNSHTLESHLNFTQTTQEISVITMHEIITCIYLVHVH